MLQNVSVQLAAFALGSAGRPERNRLMRGDQPVTRRYVSFVAQASGKPGFVCRVQIFCSRHLCAVGPRRGKGSFIFITFSFVSILFV